MLTKEYFRDLYYRTSSLGLDVSRLEVDGSIFSYNPEDDSLTLYSIGESVGDNIDDILIIPDCVDYLSSNWSKNLNHPDNIREFYADSVKEILLESDYNMENPYNLPKNLSIISLKSFKTIEVALFEHMSLSSLILSDNIENIYGYAFVNCELDTLKLKNIKRLGRNAFSGCSLNKLEIDYVDILNARSFINSKINNINIGKVGSVYNNYNTIIEIKDDMDWHDYIIYSEV